MNLLCGIMGVICTFDGNISLAFGCMLLASVFDFSDGLAARLLHAYSDVGKELDSLSDMVSFGVLPSLMLLVTMRMHGCSGWPCYLPLFLAVMSGLRLAKFNVDERQGTDFIGVATPTSAIICGSLCYLIAHEPTLLVSRWAGSVWFLPLVAITLGLLLVSEFPMFGMKVAPGHKLLDSKRIAFLGLSVAAIGLTAAFRLNLSLAVLLVFLIYIAENLLLFIARPRR